MSKTIRVIITKEPPVGTWCFGMKGNYFKVIDDNRKEYYVLASDIDKKQNARIILKDFVEEIK